MSEEVRYAGFWRRAVADCIDSMILDGVAFLIIFMILGAIYWTYPTILGESLAGKNAIQAFGSLNVQIVMVIIRSILSLGYFTYATARFGTTLGKRPLNVYVVTADQHAPLSVKASFVRCLSYMVSYLPMGCGFLMVAFQPQKRALHDLIAGTVSIVKRRS